MADENKVEGSVEKQVDPKVIDAVTVNNVKTIGEVASVSMGLAIQNAVANQQLAQQNAVASAHRLNELANHATGVLLKRIAEVDVVEAAATVKAGQSGDLSSLMTNLNAALASIQQAVKTAVTTPPVTG